MSTAAEKAVKRLTRCRDQKLQALQLARLSCLAVRVDPPLLRRLRQELLPDVDVGVEADLWFSPLVESRGVRGFVLDRHVVDVLREDLAADRRLLARVIDVTREVQRNAPPSIRLETSLNAMALLNEGDVASAIDQALRPALRALRQGGDGARAVAQWAIRALPRIHPRVKHSEGAVSLFLGASALLGLRFQATPEVPVSLENLAWVLPESVLKETTSIGVELLHRGVRFVEPAAPANTIELPATNPRLVGLSWLRNGKPVESLVEAEVGRTIDLEEDVSAVTIRTIAGDEYLLGRFISQSVVKDVDSEVVPAAVWSHLRITSGPKRTFELDVLVGERGPY